MRLSCNGCRVLRKGCSDSCSIRACLGWIKSPDAQAHATVFLAKFYGRAGLLNLLAAGAEDVRPAIFRSLLYEACGRIVNPVYGSVGLLCSGRWHMCQAAVDAVLKGDPIAVAGAGAGEAAAPAAYDIRHNSSKQHASSSSCSDGDENPLHLPASRALHKVAKPGRPRFKRTHHKPIPMGVVVDDLKHPASSTEEEEEAGSHVSQAAEQEQHLGFLQEEEQLGLDLTLAFAPLPAPAPCVPPPPPAAGDAAEPAFLGLRFL